MDWVGQKLGVPLYRYFGLDPHDAPVTTFSIGIDDPAKTRDKVREAAALKVLKIKVGLDTDEATIGAVRSVTDKPLRVDANEGWTDKEVALRKIEWLAKNGVEFVEQPMPAAQLDDMRWVRSARRCRSSPTNPCLHPADIPKLVGAFDGINVKLDKCGGIMEAYRIDPDRQSAGHEDHARVHDLKLVYGDRGSPPLAAGGLRRPRRRTC